jgi:prepilin-type N-terminal cleavage/methylation domain-containing protein
MSRSQSTNNREAIGTRQNRPGYTLLELVIVMAILASLTAIAWPRVRPMMRRSSLREAALQLKADFAEAREQAVLRGKVWEFRLHSGTSHYTIRPQGPVTAPASSSVNQLAAFDDRLPSSQPVIQDQAASARELPDGAIFPSQPASSDQAQRTSSWKPETIEREADDLLVPSLSDGVLAAQFFPDGRVTEAVIELKQRETRESIAVRLRGLTGGVTIGSVEQFAAPLGQADEGILISGAASKSVSSVESLP